MIKLDIFSDPICPWCYIGKSYLDRALEKVGNHPFNIQWHPFQLNPEMPQEGVDRKQYLETKFGSKDLAVKAYTPVLEHAGSAGLTLKLENITKTPNTLLFLGTHSSCIFFKAAAEAVLQAKTTKSQPSSHSLSIHLVVRSKTLEASRTPYGAFKLSPK